MPITRRQFELGIDETVEKWMKNIHQFVVSSKDEAFTEDELWARVERVPPEPKVAEAYGRVPVVLEQHQKRVFQLALEKLVEIRAVSARDVRSSTYYAFLRDLDVVW
jgi:hypothetical protein